MLKRVSKELQDIGLAPRIVDFPNFPSSRQGVVFDVEVRHGRYKGKTLTFALSFEDGYPEYPPHFIHLKSAIRTEITTKHSAHEFEGEEWSAYSLPPSDFWDKLESSKKNMNTFYWRHLLRVLGKL